MGCRPDPLLDTSDEIGYQLVRALEYERSCAAHRDPADVLDLQVDGARASFREDNFLYSSVLAMKGSAALGLVASFDNAPWYHRGMHRAHRWHRRDV
jgi:hypothetical protein